MILYIFAIIILIILCYWIVFKIKNPFWSLQPVLHNHMLYKKLKKPCVISPTFEITKLLNYENIKTIKWTDLNKLEKNNFQKHISNYFLRKKNIHYNPSLETHINPYFEKDNNSYLSFYTKNDILLGTICNRTLRIHLDNETFLMSYIDFLCVHYDYRKKMVAPELIQTHEFFQRTKSNKKCLVSFFKKEGKLTNIIPLVKYYTYCFSLRNINYKIPILPTGIQIAKINNNTLDLLHHFLNSVRKKFSCFVIYPLETLNNLILNESILIYTLVQNNEILGAYFFRKTGTYTNSTNQNLECFCSINNCINENVFIDGFFLALEKERKNYTSLYFESLSHNNSILEVLSKIINTTFVSPCAYYIYNFSQWTLKSEDCVILL